MTTTDRIEGLIFAINAMKKTSIRHLYMDEIQSLIIQSKIDSKLFVKAQGTNGLNPREAKLRRDITMTPTLLVSHLHAHLIREACGSGNINRLVQILAAQKINPNDSFTSMLREAGYKLQGNSFRFNTLLKPCFPSCIPTLFVSP